MTPSHCRTEYQFPRSNVPTPEHVAICGKKAALLSARAGSKQRGPHYCRFSAPEDKKKTKKTITNDARRPGTSCTCGPLRPLLERTRAICCPAPLAGFFIPDRQLRGKAQRRAAGARRGGARWSSFHLADQQGKTGDSRTPFLDPPRYLAIFCSPFLFVVAAGKKVTA